MENVIECPSARPRPIPDGYITAANAELKYGPLARKAPNWANLSRVERIKRGGLFHYNERQLVRCIELQQEIEAEQNESGKQSRSKSNKATGDRYQFWWGTSEEYRTLAEARKEAAKAAWFLKRDVVIHKRQRWNNRIIDTPLEVAEYKEQD